MAYDYGQWKIVDLIDIFNPNTDKRIVKYLSKRYVSDIASFDRRNKNKSTEKVRNYLAQEIELETAATDNSIAEQDAASQSNPEEVVDLKKMQKQADLAKPASEFNLAEEIKNSSNFLELSTDVFDGNKHELITDELVDNNMQVWLI
jgi:hypothetical protein